FLISSGGILQIPGKISGYYCIKSLVRKLQVLGIHLHPLDFFSQISRIMPGFFQHFLCIVHSCHLIAGLCQDNGKKTRSCTDVQDFCFFWFLTRKMFSQIFQPDLPLAGGQFFLIYLGISLRSFCPIFFYLIQQFHIFVSFPVFKFLIYANYSGRKYTMDFFYLTSPLRGYTLTFHFQASIIKVWQKHPLCLLLIT